MTANVRELKRLAILFMSAAFEPAERKKIFNTDFMDVAVALRDAAREIIYLRIMFFVLCVVSISVFAMLDAHAGEASRCADTSAWARIIMQARQDGEPIERAYEMVGDVPMLQELVLQAYTRPLFLSYGFQVAEIDEFSNKTFMQCVRGGQ